MFKAFPRAFNSFWTFLLDVFSLFLHIYISISTSYFYFYWSKSFACGSLTLNLRCQLRTCAKASPEACGLEIGLRSS